MANEDKRLEHLSKVALDKTRVILDPPIVFLCGGPADVTIFPSISVRGTLLDYLASEKCDLVNKITLAESFKDWTHEAIYQDLMVFEDDIAHFSSLIVIVLESAGALTELGLFARNKLINKKLLVFVSEHHYSEDSFVKLGPLRHIESMKEDSVAAYPWDDDDPVGTVKTSLSDMREDIIQALARLDKSEAFDLRNDGHLAFYIFQIINLFAALKLIEIELYVRNFWPDVGLSKIKRLIFLLMKFKLVLVFRRGHSDFYCPVNSADRLSFGGHFDSVAAKVAAMSYYAMTPSESRRFEIIQKNIARINSGGEAV